MSKKDYFHKKKIFMNTYFVRVYFVLKQQLVVYNDDFFARIKRMIRKKGLPITPIWVDGCDVYDMDVVKQKRRVCCRAVVGVDKKLYFSPKSTDQLLHKLN
jgi:hypothetical protein